MSEHQFAVVEGTDGASYGRCQLCGATNSAELCRVALLAEQDAAVQEAGKLRDALTEIAEYVEAEWREGDKAFQVAIIARTALSALSAADQDER